MQKLHLQLVPVSQEVIAFGSHFAKFHLTLRRGNHSAFILPPSRLVAGSEDSLAKFWLAKSLRLPLLDSSLSPFSFN